MPPIKRFLVLLFLALIAPTSKATHLSGTDIYMEYISGIKYKFTFVVYRDCKGVA